MKKASKVAQKVKFNRNLPVYTDSINVILVIGESFNRHHSNLYGYSLKTNPMLEREQIEGNLICFQNVVTPFNLTSEALRNLFSLNSVSDNEKWYDFPMFTTVMKGNQFNVIMWDNQKTFGKYTPSSYALNSFLYDSLVVSKSYDTVNSESWEYDWDLIDSLPVSRKKRNFYVIHLIGQHFSYSSRYERDKLSKTFSRDDYLMRSNLSISEKNILADYDNATLYNDMVMKEIIDKFRNSCSVIVYLSDHGEEVFDFRHLSGRDHSDVPSDSIIKYQYQVPMLVWVSDKYKIMRPDIIRELHDSSIKPFMTDNVAHMLFNLSQIRTEYYKPNRDVLSPSYNCERRLINRSVYR